MTVNQVKFIAIAIFAIPLFALVAFNTNSVRATSNSQEDVAATYKAKCNACHGPTSAKFYDPAVPEEEQVEAILKGKKGEKPPYMPGFEAKGMTAEQAKALAEYMKQLRTPSS